jgi:hypothetical protein
MGATDSRPELNAEGPHCSQTVENDGSAPFPRDEGAERIRPIAPKPLTKTVGLLQDYSADASQEQLDIANAVEQSLRDLGKHQRLFRILSSLTRA